MTERVPKDNAIGRDQRFILLDDQSLRVSGHKIPNHCPKAGWSRLFRLLISAGVVDPRLHVEPGNGVKDLVPSASALLGEVQPGLTGKAEATHLLTGLAQMMWSDENHDHDVAATL